MFTLPLYSTGSAMANLANAYIFAGRHDDALSLHQKALEFRQGALPANHPDIGAPSPPAHNSHGDVLVCAQAPACT